MRGFWTRVKTLSQLVKGKAASCFLITGESICMPHGARNEVLLPFLKTIGCKTISERLTRCNRYINHSPDRFKRKPTWWALLHALLDTPTTQENCPPGPWHAHKTTRVLRFGKQEEFHLSQCRCNRCIFTFFLLITATQKSRASSSQIIEIFR